jgi:hypothetical protein
MGAGYGGTGASLAYQQSASFTQEGGFFVLDLLSSDAVGFGFDSAVFTISLNSVSSIVGHSPVSLPRKRFSETNLIGVPLPEPVLTLSHLNLVKR